MNKPGLGDMVRVKDGEAVIAQGVVQGGTLSQETHTHTSYVINTKYSDGFSTNGEPWIWGAPPALGRVSFVDASKIQSSNPGYCYKRTGWRHVGYTKGELVALQLLPSEMPAPAPAQDMQLSFQDLERKGVPV